jgi:glycosyltransferase involved in cell wall biosynthesis
MAKVLLLAYEFPPVVAAQSLRWFYLANALARNGIEIDVLAPRIWDKWQFSGALEPGVRVHRVFPGPFVGFSGWLARRARSNTDPGPEAANAGPGLIQSTYVGMRRVLDHLLFPDVRTEWLPFAYRRLCTLIREGAYSVVLSSHEPGVDLLLGWLVKKRYPGLYWVVDLADPFLTPYTPRWRRWLDQRFEKSVCARADRVLTTTEAATALLQERHGQSRGKFAVIPQGFALRPQEPSSLPRSRVEALMPRGGFTLLYTGSLYPRFRNPANLIAALHQIPSIRLVVAGDAGGFQRGFEALGDRVRILGKIEHFACLALQREATVLVNIGNTQSYQVPGKYYEYLGSGRPILHLYKNADDPTAALIANQRRGVAVLDHPQSIATALSRLLYFWQHGELDGQFSLSLESVRAESWDSRAQALLGTLAPALSRGLERARNGTSSLVV